MLTAAARSFLITTTLICSAALLSACGGDTTHEEDHTHTETSSSSTEPVHSSSSEAPSNKPDAFSFEDQEDVEPGAEVTSNTIVIQGMDEPVAIEISGGYYAINSEEDEAFTDQPGEIEAGDELTLRTQAPANGSQVQEVNVIIGGVNGLWRVSTPEDTEAPQAAFAFPTPMTATDAETLTLRGTASDELSQIDAVTVTVEGEGGTEIYTAESDDDFATWRVEVSLAPGDNQIQLGAEDVLGNTDNNLAEITVRQQSFGLAFPDNEERFAQVEGMGFDVENNRLLLAERDTSISSTASVRAVDLRTGKRSRFARSQPDLQISSVRGVELDYKRDRVLIGAGNDLVSVGLSSGEYTLLAGPGVPSSDEPTFRDPYGLLLDPEDDDYLYMVSAGDRRLLHLNLNTGERRIITDNNDDQPLRFFGTYSVVLGPDSKTAYIHTRGIDPSIYMVDLETGDREVMDMEGYPDTRFDRPFITDMVSAPGRQQFYIADQADEIFLYDIETSTYESVVQFSEDHFIHWMDYRMSLDEDDQVMMLVELNTKAVVAVDLQTQEYVLVSKSVDDD